ncbi:hypothetical protein BJ912DRAFT_868626 [Pholiota molesta]|nr:hypothetical protein BJ912DRAFT_868626 [Pholiota molesta]
MVIDLLSLPQELHIRILSHLDAISLTHCAMTCQSMYRTLQTTSQLLYIIQLHFAGLTDAGTDIAHAELIERLRRHRQAWSFPNATGKREYVAIDMQYQCHACELVGGVFANTDGHHFEVVSPPTSSNEESRTPRAAEPGMRIRDFTMDPTQDVIAFLEDERDTKAPRIVRVHIRTLSTNKFHPRAQQSFLQVSIPSRSDRFSNRIHTACLYFARDTFVLYLCTFDQERPYIQIWDWKTAEVILDCSVPFDRAISERRFEFVLLDSTYCFITDPLGAGSIRLYAIVRSPAEAAARAPVHLATLHLPPTADDSVQVRKISSGASPLTAHPRPDAPFVLNGDDRLHVFTLQYGYPGGASRVLNLFVHQRVFTRYCTPRAGDGGGPREVPWEAWGPVHTRLVYPAKILRHLLMCVGTSFWG